MTVLVVAHDPGGAAALVPVLRELARRSERTRLIAAGPALKVFEEAKLAPEVPGEPDAAIAGADALLMGTSFESALERDHLDAAAVRGVPAAALVDSWTNYRRRFGAALPDVVLSPDGLAAREMVSEGIPSRRIATTGQPALAEFAAEAAQPGARSEARRRVGVQEGETVVAFFSQPIGAMYGRTRGYDEVEALALVQQALPPGARLIVKGHPKEARDPASGVAADDLVLAADVVAGMTSIALVKGALAGRRVVSVEPGASGASALVLARLGLLRPARDVDEVRDAFRSPAPRPPYSWSDPGAAARVADIAQALARGDRAPHLRLQGTRVRVEPLRPEDADGPYPAWLNDPEVTAGTSHGGRPYSRADARTFIERSEGLVDEIVLAIRLAEGGRHVGNLSLKRISAVNASAELAILVGDRSVWGKGVALEACRLLLDHGFRTFDLHRVICGTFETNVGMQRLAERLGMALEGRRRQAATKHGRYLDILEYGLLRSEHEGKDRP